MKTTVHVGTDADARLAIDAGANGIEHAPRGLSDDDDRADGGEESHVHADQRRSLDLRVEAPGRRRRGRSRTPAGPAGDPADPAGSRHRRWRRYCGTGRWRIAWRRRLPVRSTRPRGPFARACPILAGSDAGNPVTFHGVSLIRELELLAQAGMPLGDVLKSATSRAADRLGPVDARPHRARRGGRPRGARARSHRAGGCLSARGRRSISAAGSSTPSG